MPLVSGFHTNVFTVIFNQPVVKFLKIRVDGRKRFLLILRYSVFAGCYDGCNDNIFVNIKSTADGVKYLS